MASDWAETTVGAVAEAVTKGTTPTTLGFNFQQEGVRFVKVESITPDGALLPERMAFISPEADSALARSRLRKDDVLFTIAGTIGRVALVPSWVLPANTNQAVAIVRPDPRKVDPRFLKYALSDRRFLQHASERVVQGVQANFSLGELKSAKFLLPSPEEQSRICEVLSALDHRIDLLRQTNATLEAIAQALFKSWFVDFDPVRAKAEGREPEGMDAETAVLFPSEFEQSELGLIPKGWRVQAVYEAAQYINGAAYKAFNPNAERRGLPIIKIAELKSGVTSQTAFSDEEMPGKYRIDSGDILFSWSGNPDTSIDTFVWTRGPALLNQHIFRVVPASERDRSITLAMLRFLRPRFTEIARNKQTTGLGHVTVTDMKEMLVTIPPPQVVAAWNRVVDPVVEKSFRAQILTQTLEQLRDTLLPRLVSGKLRLPETESIIEESLA
jgi:type I restriction enzyme S subunit